MRDLIKLLIRQEICLNNIVWGRCLRVMALDIGKVRVGIAISDPAENIATPLCVLPAQEVESNAPSFCRLIQDWEPELLVCGIPYTLKKEEGPQALNIKSKAKSISETCGIPYVLTDERLSSQEAKRNLREEGMSEKEMRGKIDMIAASLFLQSWLDGRKN